MGGGHTHTHTHTKDPWHRISIVPVYSRTVLTKRHVRVAAGLPALVNQKATRISPTAPSTGTSSRPTRELGRPSATGECGTSRMMHMPPIASRSRMHTCAVRITGDDTTPCAERTVPP